MFQAMKDLYSLVKGTPNLANVPVIDMTGSCFSDGGTLGWYGLLTHLNLTHMCIKFTQQCFCMI